MQNEKSAQASSWQKYFDKLKRPSQFSKPQLVVFVLIFALIGYLIFHTFAASTVVASLEGEQMKLPAGGSVINDTTASGGKAVLLAKTGTTGWAKISGSVNFPSTVTSMSVVAKQSYCSGYPYMKVVLDGTQVWGGFVSSNSWKSYTANFSTAYKAGAHSLAISITNDSGKHSCDVNRYVDVTNFFGPTTVTTPPTLALSASPTTVNAGQSSTLTWSSTNATACSASGAWSGSEPTSGSISTGALNQSSTYSLTCTGSSGSATASATVTVNTAVVPTVSLSASPATISSGQSSTLSWSSTNASACTASGSWSGSITTSGSKSVAPTATSTYSLTCTGSGGSATASTTVTVSGSGLSLGSLLFGDEFNGAAGTKPDSTVWGAKSSTSGSSLANWSGWNQISENGSGDVVITAVKQSTGRWDTGWLSGKVGYSGQRYIEARGEIACGYGTWNGLVWEWDYPYGAGGFENDVIESLGKEPTNYHTTIHNWTVSPNLQSGFTVSTGQTLCNSFHNYGAAVYPDRVDFYLDGNKVSTRLASAIGLSDLTTFKDVANISLNMGGWGGTPTITGPATMQVDYIHVYKLN